MLIPGIPLLVVFFASTTSFRRSRKPVDRPPAPRPPPLFSRHKVRSIVAGRPEGGARVVGEVDRPGLGRPGLDLAVGAVVRHHDVEDMRESRGVDARGVPEDGCGPDRRMPDE